RSGRAVQGSKEIDSGIAVQVKSSRMNPIHLLCDLVGELIQLVQISRKDLIPKLKLCSKISGADLRRNVLIRSDDRISTIDRTPPGQRLSCAIQNERGTAGKIELVASV